MRLPPVPPVRPATAIKWDDPFVTTVEWIDEAVDTDFADGFNDGANRWNGSDT